MGTTRAQIEQTIRAFLIRAGKPSDNLAPGTALYAEGLRLDSLETAELSAALEDEFGTDPFQGGTMPQTVGDIVGFYDSVAAGA